MNHKLQINKTSFESHSISNSDMEWNLINGSIDRDFPLKPQAQSFLTANGTNHSHASQITGIEMVAVQSVTYISLKDILPATEPATTLWPAYDRKDSWREIPIKNPLLQHAAWAYLQPMAAAREADDRSCFARLKDGCFGGLFGCFGGFINGVVFPLFWGNENLDEDDSKFD